MEVHPVERHEREEMPHMQRGRCGIYADVRAYAFFRQQPVESFTATATMLVHLCILIQTVLTRQRLLRTLALPEPLACSAEHQT
jgi:hypothetical protein